MAKFKIIRDSIVKCDDCGWLGYENELEWRPFEPKGDYLYSQIKFSKICPMCKSSENIYRV